MRRALRRPAPIPNFARARRPAAAASTSAPAAAPAPNGGDAPAAAPPRARPDGADLAVTFQDVARAHARIRDGVERTRCARSHFLSQLLDPCGSGLDIWLKHEQQQFTGSFKERGARNALLLLSAAQRAEGVVAASAGNHALALARHGADLGVSVTVCMPTIAPLAKQEKCRALGAHVVLAGDHLAEARAVADRDFAHKTYVNGYDDPEIIAGAGTLGLEICEQARRARLLARARALRFPSRAAFRSRAFPLGKDP